MNVTKDFYLNETQRKKRQFYQAPLRRKKQRVSAPAELAGPVKQWSQEEIFLENLKRFAWKGNFQT